MPQQLAAAPEPVRRWILSAIDDGCGMGAPYRFVMSGEIKLNGVWRPFRGVQLSGRSGYIWAAALRVVGLPVGGYDRFTQGVGEMRWRMLGVVPLMTASGPDVTRSAAGRLAAEAGQGPMG